MNDKCLYWGSTVFAAFALLLMLVNVALINGNRNLQTELNGRQNEINGAPQVGQLNQALLQALAQASIDNDDKQICDLLESQGFTLKAKAEKVEKIEKKK